MSAKTPDMPPLFHTLFGKHSLPAIFRKIMLRAAYRLATYGIAREESSESRILIEHFLARCRAMERPSVLELGAKRSVAACSTRHDAWIPHAGQYLGTDIENGADVDLVADVHHLTEVTGEEQFDAIISCSTFEHFQYPHIAAHEIMKALRIGGVVFIQTHQSYPLHAYPHDYFRFSREALASLFGTRMGFRVLATAYEFPASVFSAREPNTAKFPAFLNVLLFGEKTEKTPSAYLFDL